MTDHIVNKSLVLSEFRKCTGENIRSANKNRVENIRIDEKGDLFLQPINSKEEVIKLPNVIAAGNILARYNSKCHIQFFGSI